MAAFYDFIIRAQSQVKPGFDKALAETKSFGGAFQDAMKFTKGFLGIEAIAAGARGLAAVIQGVRGDAEAAWATVERIPILGPAIASVHELGKAFDDSAQRAERLKKKMEGIDAFRGGLASITAPNYVDALRRSGMTSRDQDFEALQDRQRAEMDALEAKRDANSRNPALNIRQLTDLNAELYRQQTALEELHQQQRIRFEDEFQAKKSETANHIDELFQAELDRERDWYRERQQRQDDLAEKMFADDDAERDRVNRTIELQRRAATNDLAREQPGGMSYRGSVQGVAVSNQFHGYAAQAESNAAANEVREMKTELGRKLDRIADYINPQKQQGVNLRILHVN